MRLRAENLAGGGNNTGDITHLEARPSISLFLRYVNTYFRFLFVVGQIPQNPNYSSVPYLPARIASLAFEEYSALAQGSFSQQCRIGES